MQFLKACLKEVPWGMSEGSFFRNYWRQFLEACLKEVPWGMSEGSSLRHARRQIPAACLEVVPWGMSEGSFLRYVWSRTRQIKFFPRTQNAYTAHRRVHAILKSEILAYTKSNHSYSTHVSRVRQLSSPESSQKTFWPLFREWGVLLKNVSE